MTFVDRVSAYPGRYIMTTEDGSTAHVVLEKDDEPIVVGTPLNAETFNGIFAGLYPARESAPYPGCFYREVDGEMEWLNPPMLVGKTYRTTERYKGLPVYVMTGEVVMVSDNGHIAFRGPIIESEIVSVYATAYYMDGTTKCFFPPSSISVSLYHEDIISGGATDSTTCRIGGPPAGANVVVTIKYVKE